MFLIEGKNYAPERLGRVLVLGFGKSGQAVARYVASLPKGRAESLTIMAGDRNPEADELARELHEKVNAKVLFGSQKVEGVFDLCITSPGIPPTSTLFRSAKSCSVEVIGEVEFAWREADENSRWVGITGTNGKTTTVSLTEHVLKEAGLHAKAVGNIGDTCLEAVAHHVADVYVAELSSYQLSTISRLTPQVAVILNITPDHITWHGSFEEYRYAKMRILENLPKSHGLAVLNATDETVGEMVEALQQIPAAEAGFDTLSLGTAEGISGDARKTSGQTNAAWLGEDGALHVALAGQEYTLASADALQIKGSHNIENALAAAACALALGADPKAVSSGLTSFAPLEHRIEPCGVVNGVACYNDSKATNVDATLKAFSAFGSIKPIVLLGGRDKQTDLSELVQVAKEHAKAVVCYGESHLRFATAFEKVQEELPVLHAAHMEDALDTALAFAEAGDIVLLSPACASFDEFNSFEERGKVFKQLVASRSA